MAYLLPADFLDLPVQSRGPHNTAARCASPATPGIAALLCPYCSGKMDHQNSECSPVCRQSWVHSKTDDVLCRAKDLIKQLLDVHPTKRLTAMQALQHPWCLDKMQGHELTDLSMTRAKLRKKDDQHRFKVRNSAHSKGREEAAALNRRLSVLLAAALSSLLQLSLLLVPAVSSTCHCKGHLFQTRRWIVLQWSNICKSVLPS